MAGLWKLPCIYVIENNHYGMGTSAERAAHNPLFYTRGGIIPGIRADGQNVFLVREVMKYVKEFSIKNGPLFLELMTYRYHGHSMSDPGLTYRSRDEIAEMRKSRDPIESLKGLILHHKVAEEKELKEMEKGVRKDIDADVEKIHKDPEPPMKELITDIYVEPTVVRNIEFSNPLYPS